jgi:hypothetical protein
MRTALATHPSTHAASTTTRTTTVSNWTAQPSEGALSEARIWTGGVRKCSESPTRVMAHGFFSAQAMDKHA